jgi:hypothetical protein
VTGVSHFGQRKLHSQTNHFFFLRFFDDSQMASFFFRISGSQLLSLFCLFSHDGS